MPMPPSNPLQPTSFLLPTIIKLKIIFVASQILMMPRVFREEMAPLAGASVAMVSFAGLLRGTMMPDLDTQLMAMTLMWYGLHLLQYILGPMRRHSDHWLVQYGAMASHYLPLPLAVYAVKTVRNSSSDGTLFQEEVWRGVLVLMLSHPIIFPSMSVYTLGGSPFRNGQILQSGFYLYLLLNIINPPSRRAKFVLAHVAQLVRRAVDWSLISSQQQSDAKARGDHVKEMVPLDGDASNNISQEQDYYCPIMQKYGPWVKVLAMAKGEDYILSDYCVTVNGGTGDILLSSSFCQLLTRRYFGFDCAEEGNSMVRDFMLSELMLPDYSRAFAIVEAQLDLLHDHFFFPYQFWLISFNFLDSCWGSFLIQEIQFVWLLSTLYDMLRELAPASYFPLAAVVFLGLLIWVYLKQQLSATNWCTILNAVRTRSLLVTPSTGNTRFRRGPYWKNKIGQYSIIEDYDSCSAKKTSLFFLKGIISSRWPPSFKHHPVEQDAIRLPESVRKLIARTLRDTNGPPTNGIRSLLKIRDRTTDDLSWTCRQETHTHTILMWHIATCYCDMSPPHSYWPENFRLQEIHNNYEAATALSRYCGYLVAFLPEFLPEHKGTTQSLFQHVLEEAKAALRMNQETHWSHVALQRAKVVLGLKMSMEEKRTKIRRLGLLEMPFLRPRTFEEGVRLGRQLEKLNTLLRWKVMAEFWAETILYIAPSDNVALHVEHLAKGGEFVTHLWAMLSNAGILKRARDGGAE